MIKTRVFSANTGDKSIGNAGADGLKTDIDNMMANQAWNDEVIKKGNEEEYVPDTDYSPATKKYVDDHATFLPHASEEDIYGLGDLTKYGHVKIVDDLTKSEYKDGEVLSARQGKILKGNSISSYLAFCANVNTASLDAAFGKNNEDIISGIGRQLAMYAWFKGDSKTTYPFTNLLTCNTLGNIITNAAAIDEILANTTIYNLIQSNTYAKETTYFAMLCRKSGVSILSSISEFIEDATAMTNLALSNDTLVFSLSNSSFVTAMFSSANALQKLYDNTTTTMESTFKASTVAKTVANTLAQNRYVTFSYEWTSITTKPTLVVRSEGGGREYSKTYKVGIAERSTDNVFIFGFVTALEGQCYDSGNPCTFYYITW